MSYTVAQNTSFFTVASVLQKIVSFVYFAIIARIIGVDNTGIYFFAVAYTTIFVVFADFGLGTVFTREASRNKEKAAGYLNTLISAKLMFGVLTYILVVVSVNLLGYSDLTKNLIYISGITMFFDNIHNIFYSFFRSKQNLFFESVGIVFSQILTLIIGTLALFNKLPLYWLILAYTIPSFLNVVYVSLIYRSYFKLKLLLSFDFSLFKKFLIIAWPFALAGAIMRLYNYSDSLLMSKMLTPRELGLWGVVYKMSSSFYFLAIALSSSIYPVFSTMYIKDKAKVIYLFQKSYRYLFFLSFPIIGGIMVLAQPIMNLVYGSEYSPSVLPLQIAIVSLIFVFVTYINGSLLNAIDKQKLNTAILGSALVISIILNIILLPRLGIIGAAIVVVLTSIWLAKIGYLYCNQYLKIEHHIIFKYFNQTFWPACTMAACVYFLADKIYFLWTIPIGGIIYLGLVFLTGGLSKQILLNIKNKLT